MKESKNDNICLCIRWIVQQCVSTLEPITSQIIEMCMTFWWKRTWIRCRTRMITFPISTRILTAINTNMIGRRLSCNTEKWWQVLRSSSKIRCGLHVLQKTYAQSIQICERWPNLSKVLLPYPRRPSHSTVNNNKPKQTVRARASTQSSWVKSKACKRQAEKAIRTSQFRISLEATIHRKMLATRHKGMEATRRKGM